MVIEDRETIALIHLADDLKSGAIAGRLIEGFWAKHRPVGYQIDILVKRYPEIKNLKAEHFGTPGIDRWLIEGFKRK